jgi:hypothetical protein
MAGWQDFIKFEEDFIGAQVLTAATTPGTGIWKLTVTGAAPPTAVVATAGNGGELVHTLTSASQIQVLTTDFANNLTFELSKLISAEFRVKCSAAFTADVSLGFGLQTARNDNLDSTTRHAQFRLKGNNNVLCETDDDVIDRSAVATGQTLSTVYKRFFIDFSGGLSDVKFYIDGVRVAAATAFNMSAATGSVQPFFQLQKAVGTEVGNATWDYVCINARR